MQRSLWRYLFCIALILLILSSLALTLRLSLAYLDHPQAILVLGGGDYREKFATTFAQQHPTLDIWISSGQAPQVANGIFQTASIKRDRIHLDYRATDTVTNFTTLIPDFQTRNIHHLYLITSDYHMPRARAIAFIVLGSQGIAFTPIPIPSSQPNESWLRIGRDMGRSLLWVFTRRTGASLKA